MPYLKFVSGVVVPKVCIIQAAFFNASLQIGLQADQFVTSGNDRVHMRGSKHYTDEALDFRSKHLTTAQKHALLTAVKARLPKGYQAILESEGSANEHFQIEYDPS